MFERWNSTVLTLTTISWAISLFVSPWAASSATRRSVGSQPSLRCRPTRPDPLELRTSHVGPAGRAQLVERRVGLLERLACRTPLPEPSLGAAEAEERPRAVGREAEAASSAADRASASAACSS